jgi:hypothetical protein
VASEFVSVHIRSESIPSNNQKDNNKLALTFQGLERETETDMWRTVHWASTQVRWRPLLEIVLVGYPAPLVSCEVLLSVLKGWVFTPGGLPGTKGDNSTRGSPTLVLMSTCRQPLIPPLYYFFIFHFLFLYSFSSHCSETHITITSYASHNSPFSISGPFTITLHTNFTKITITQIITSITVTHLQESQDSLHTFTRTSITHLQRITRIGKENKSWIISTHGLDVRPMPPTHPALVPQPATQEAATPGWPAACRGGCASHATREMPAVGEAATPGLGHAAPSRYVHASAWERKRGMWEGESDREGRKR